MRKRFSIGVVLAALLAMMFGTVGTALAFTVSNQVNFNLTACRNNGSITLPNGSGDFICPDAAYVSGNLGKGWNELDLVPHRLTTTVGSQANATTSYDVIIAADYQLNSKTGYDVISAPVINTSQSDASCQITNVSAQQTATNVTGGVDTVIYRVVSITQDKGTTCVLDYYQRLALGAHLYSGSSLQSYMFESDNFQTGKRTLSIPVNQIAPQELSKDMSATQGSDHAWDITKSATPATVSFGNTCDPAASRSAAVTVTVSWTKKAATPNGPITIITHVYATNPAARVVTINVADNIRSGTTVLDTASAGPTNVPANTANYLVLTHQTTVPAGTTNLNDVATATYTDTATGVPVPGSTTATASATVQQSGVELNQSAIINDIEQLTGAHLTFSADSFSGASGAFDGGYVVGTATTGPVSWTSNSQTGSGSVSFNKTINVDAGSSTSGTLSDVATLTGSDGFTNSANASVDISSDARVKLTINKTIDHAVNSNATFTFVVKNSQGNTVATPSISVSAGSTSASQTLSNLAPDTYTVSEDQVAGWVTDSSKSANINLPTCSGSVTLNNTGAKDLTVSKTATPAFNRDFTWTIDKSVDKTRIDIAEGGTATFNYTVAVNHTAHDSGWTVSGQITVNNPNGFDVNGVNITDSIDHGGSCSVTNGTNVTIAAGDSATRAYSCTFSSAPGSGTNTATATWTSFGSPNTTASGTANYDFGTVNPTITHGTITVVDDKTDPAHPVTLGNADYTQHNPIEFTYSLTKSGVAGTCTDYTNTAIIQGTTQSDSQTVTVCVGKDLTVSKTAPTSFTRTYHWTIDKSVDKTKVTIADGGTATFNYTVSVSHDNGTDTDLTVAGKITVTNPNDWEDIVVNVTDALDTGPCSVTNGTNVTVPAGKSVVLDYACAPADPTATNNTATATWDQTTAHTPSGTASGSANVVFSNPTIVDGSISVVDDKTDPAHPVALGTASYTDPSPKTFNYSLTKSGVAGTCTNYNNTATFTTNDTGTTGSASQTVTVCVGKDLTVSKTANPSFARDYLWNITKAVDKTTVTQTGGTATFNYTVNVNETGFTDSGWVVNGTITVANPNDFEAITANLTDAVNNGGTCSVTNGTNVNVPASGSASRSYTCIYASAPNPSAGTNTATATWDKTAASTPNGSASGTANFAFTTPTSTTHKTITVTDTFNGTTTTLGTATATDTQPYTTKTFNYSRSIAVAPGCKSYTNTAKIVETGQNASQTVTVCGPTQTGALTMGFWQNKNGQGIITGQAKSGTCPSATWLRTYAPFQDLSATATCAQVGTYVTNVIKAANAGGATMNAMLKAQMLATALDVYFSDPTLGGNKINAPAPIGGVKIDLTKICKMTDSSSGGTCSGTNTNASAAFGGATSLTVSQLLSYAASQSNVGGTTWYAQVKATQELAKNTFDAINNQVAFTL